MGTYDKLLTDPRWQRKRLEIMNEDNFTCQICGDKVSTLTVHHIRYIKGLKPWEYSNSLLITLCNDCHDFVHYRGRWQWIIEFENMQRANIFIND